VRTADLDFIQSIWPNVEAALHWIEKYGDRDRDGFVEYCRQSDNGLIQQGWKDSHDSVFHADGTIAEAPIALCEVQGYVYAAKRAAAQMARALGHDAKAKTLDVDADLLKSNFAESFWCPELEMFALALDGQKRPCRVRTSNPGHCLYSGIASEHAALIARTLLTQTSSPVGECEQSLVPETPQSRTTMDPSGRTTTLSSLREFQTTASATWRRGSCRLSPM
jgi:glycogen debranching enzyme